MRAARCGGLQALACLAFAVCARAQGSAAAPAPAARPLTLSISVPKSVLTFSIRRPGETIEGTAREFTGEVRFDPADPSAGSSVVLRVVASSLETGNRLRDRKMHGAHLEVERFPEIVFRSTSITVGTPDAASGSRAPSAAAECPPFGAGDRRALVEGTLSLHGVTRSLLVPAAIRYDDRTLSAEGCVHLTYSDYGIPIPRFLWLVMDDDIQVSFRLVAATGVSGGS